MLLIQLSFVKIENWILSRMPEATGQGKQQGAGSAGDAGEGHGEPHGEDHGESHGWCHGWYHGRVMMNKSGKDFALAVMIGDDKVLIVHRMLQW